MINPQQLIGNWHIGYALDIHVINSIPLGDNKYNNTYSDTGKRVYTSKYSQASLQEKENAIQELSKVASAVLTGKYPNIQNLYPQIDYLFAVPFSVERDFQPVEILVEKISKITNIPLLKRGTILKTKTTRALKSVSEEEAEQEIKGAFTVNNPEIIKNKNILIIDDLFGTGTTLTELTKTIKEQSSPATISILTMTKTRTKGGLKPSNDLPF